MNPQFACAFTGHRPERLPWGYDEDDSRCLRFKMKLESLLVDAYDQGIRHYITGMALGTDQIFAELVLQLQEDRGDITLECAIPCRSQPNAWNPLQQERYEKILSHSQFETLVQHDYSQGCMMRRNRYMIDHANILIAAYDGIPKGGTAKTIAYAMKKDAKLFILSLNGEEYL